MPQRLRYGKAFPEGIHALFELGRAINAERSGAFAGGTREDAGISDERMRLLH